VQVFLVRHAEAVDETLMLRDPYRHLTPRGRQQARSLGDRLRWHDCVPTKIWTSPLVRAVQTAELVAIGLACSTEVETIVDLEPHGSARKIEQAVRALPADAAVMLVGHEPSISAIGSLILGTELDALDKAEAVRILDGTVRWRFAWNAEAPTGVTK
jgi:phosphohistidine phosphatase